MPEYQLGWGSFIENFPDSIARYDNACKYLFINKAIEKEIMIPAAEVIGKSNRDLKIPNDEALLVELEGKIKKVFATGQPANHYTQHEFPHGIQYYYMKLIPDFAEEQERERVVRSVWALTRDITHLKQTEIDLKNAEANLRRQNAELFQLNTDLDDFFHTVSHDMGGPLNNLKGLINLLKEAQPEEIPLITQMLEESTQRFEDVLTGLTEILKIKNKQEPIQQTELNAVLQVVISEFQSSIQQTQTTIQADFSLCPVVRYARAHLESLFRNLISNASKYRSKEHSPHIQISANRVASYVILTFQDNGQGIDLERNRDKIFRPFYQVDATQEGKGMG